MNFRESAITTVNIPIDGLEMPAEISIRDDQDLQFVSSVPLDISFEGPPSCTITEDPKAEYTYICSEPTRSKYHLVLTAKRGDDVVKGPLMQPAGGDGMMVEPDAPPPVHIDVKVDPCKGCLE